MGVVKKPSLREYWSNDDMFGNPNFRDLLSFDHFEQIRGNIHFSDETNKNYQDPLYKIRFLIDHVIFVSQSLYVPEQTLTIDESMIRFSGRNIMKVFIPLKPIKYGFKAYVLAESSTK